MERRAVGPKGELCQVFQVGVWWPHRGRQVERVMWVARVHWRRGGGPFDTMHRMLPTGAHTPYFDTYRQAQHACRHWLVRHADPLAKATP